LATRYKVHIAQPAEKGCASLAYVILYVEIASVLYRVTIKIHVSEEL